MTEQRKKVIVIGAGAAGIAAAIVAAASSKVTVLEHMEKPLKKLLITGNGRCNFSNTDMDSSHYHGDKEIIENVLSAFSVDDCLDFLEECHVEALEVHYRYNDNGYFYPSTNRADTVRDGMLERLSELGGKILCGVKIRGVSKHNDGFRVKTENGDLTADRIIFACGSNAAPETGSDSSIYSVLKDLGVKFHSFLPALSGVTSASLELKKLHGCRCRASVRLSDLSENTDYITEDGEVQFGNGYVSGIPVLQLSRYVSIGRKKGHEMVLIITPSEWENIRTGDGVFPEEIRILCAGTRGFSYAQCCSGGVDTKELDPFTLEWKKQKGIFFCGEMIDVDGDCGGYNLHFAFGSGTIAGKAASL